ncbi:MAG: DUF1501 domain-containing protein, partial [Planctomycetia bacterium]
MSTERRTERDGSFGRDAAVGDAGCCGPAPPVSRREALLRTGLGMGWLGAASLLAREAPAASTFAARPPHFGARARAVIHVFANGGPSHVDSFDPKPALATYAGKEIPGTLKTERRTGAALP